jgi:hypothetical protein
VIDRRLATLRAALGFLQLEPRASANREPARLAGASANLWLKVKQKDSTLGRTGGGGS